MLRSSGKPKILRASLKGACIHFHWCMPCVPQHLHGDALSFWHPWDLSPPYAQLIDPAVALLKLADFSGVPSLHCGQVHWAWCMLH